MRIFIGSENKLFSLSGSSMIAAPFRDGSQKIVGVVGVIGPTRLNYARIVPMVDYTARVVSKMLDPQRALSVIAFISPDKTSLLQESSATT